MRNLSFYKLPFRRNFMSLRKDSALLPYSFLQSYKMESMLESLPASSPIKKFMSNDFTQQQLQREKYLFRELIEKEIEVTKSLNERIRLKDFNVIETMDVLVNNNILDFDMWIDLLKVTLTTRLEELELEPDFSDIVIIFRKYIEKFVNRSLLHRFKFNLNDVLLKDTDFGSILSDMYTRKGHIKSIKDQRNIFAFIKEINLKQAINMSEAKKYYTKQIPVIKELLAQEKDISIIPAFNSIFTSLGIQTPEVTKMFEQRLEQIYHDTKAQNKYFDLYDVLQVSSTWANTGKFNPKLKINNIGQMSDLIISNSKTIQFFYSLIMVNLETPQLIDKIILATDLQQININLKVILHKCFHILAIRGHDLSKHSKLIRKISSVCLSNYHIIIQILQKNKIPIKSPCICRSDSTSSHAISESIGDSNIDYIIKRMHSMFLNNDNGDKRIFLKTLRFCRFSMDGIIIKNNDIYSLDFEQNGDYLIKPIGEKKLRLEVLRYYGFKVCKINPLCPELLAILEKGDDLDQLFQYVKRRDDTLAPQHLVE